MDIPNNNVDSDAEAFSPEGSRSALFSHQNNNPDFSSPSDDDDNDSIKNPPNDKGSSKSPYTRANKTTFLVNFKGLSLSDLYRNKHSSALIKLQTKAINSGSNAYKKELAAFYPNHQVLGPNREEFDGAIDQDIEQMEAVAAKTRQIKQKKAKSVVSSKGNRPQDLVEYDITKGHTFPCPKCGHMLVMQLDTTEPIATYTTTRLTMAMRTK
eukprot:jgi/Psemu1/7230/gm1.7230_g